MTESGLKVFIMTYLDSFGDILSVIFLLILVGVLGVIIYHVLKIHRYGRLTLSVGKLNILPGEELPCSVSFLAKKALTIETWRAYVYCEKARTTIDSEGQRRTHYETIYRSPIKTLEQRRYFSATEKLQKTFTLPIPDLATVSTIQNKETRGYRWHVYSQLGGEGMKWTKDKRINVELDLG